MQSNNLAQKAELDEVSRSALLGSEVALVRAIQLSRGAEPCFRTDQRLFCENDSCEWRKDCKRLVAIWRR